MADIAKELDISAPALMSRFGSKSGLLRAFLAWGNKASMESFKAAARDNPSPLEALRARFRNSERDKDHEFGDALNHINIVAFHTAAWIDPDLHDLEYERRSLYLNEVISLLTEAVNQGELEGCNPESLGRAMVAAIAGAALRWMVDPPPDVGGPIVSVIDELLHPYLIDTEPSGRA